MKRTNSLLSSFWVKVVPVFLLLIGLGFTNAIAQNYKPLDEAISSVNTATESLKATKTSPIVTPDGSSTKIGGHAIPAGPSAVLLGFEISYYGRFVELAKLNGSVSAAMEALNAEFPPSSIPLRNTIMTQGKADLLHLIIY
jgi:hypothetical protein